MRYGQVESVSEAVEGAAGVFQRPSLAAARIVPGVEFGLEIVTDEIVEVSFAVGRFGGVEVCRGAADVLRGNCRIRSSPYR
ncbi:MAG TPA: hypothetical protein VKE70_19005 [Candidatus Solibacter sp.]|nr:hypothetical protein [Candidatus Solibacter sp.]